MTVVFFKKSALSLDFFIISWRHLHRMHFYKARALSFNPSILKPIILDERITKRIHRESPNRSESDLDIDLDDPWEVWIYTLCKSLTKERRGRACVSVYDLIRSVKWLSRVADLQNQVIFCGLFPKCLRCCLGLASSGRCRSNSV